MAWIRDRMLSLDGGTLGYRRREDAATHTREGRKQMLNPGPGGVSGISYRRH
jgi:hypothetical protein